LKNGHVCCWQAADVRLSGIGVWGGYAHNRTARFCWMGHCATFSRLFSKFGKLRRRLKNIHFSGKVLTEIFNRAFISRTQIL
jgi:hypothetical protein